MFITVCGNDCLLGISQDSTDITPLSFLVYSIKIIIFLGWAILSPWETWENQGKQVPRRLSVGRGGEAK
jgi:hypothetical protein